jgi:hypothetical protein
MYNKISIRIASQHIKEENNFYTFIGEVQNTLNRNRGNTFLRIELSTKDVKKLFDVTLCAPSTEGTKFDYSKTKAYSFGCSFKKKRIKKVKDLFVIDNELHVDTIPDSVARIIRKGRKYELYMIGRHATDVGPTIAGLTKTSKKIDDEKVERVFGKRSSDEIGKI